MFMSDSFGLAVPRFAILLIPVTAALVQEKDVPVVPLVGV